VGFVLESLSPFVSSGVIVRRQKLAPILNIPPLLSAVSHRDEKIARFLLENGADVNARGSSGETALHVATAKGNKQITELLLEWDARLRFRKSSGETPLMFAEQNERHEIVELLLSYESRQDEPIHSAARDGDIDKLHAILSEGAEIDSRNACGLTPLHLAAFVGHEKIVELLLEKGADVNAIGRSGETALHEAAFQGFERIAARSSSPGGLKSAPRNHQARHHCTGQSSTITRIRRNSSFPEGLTREREQGTTGRHYTWQKRRNKRRWSPSSKTMKKNSINNSSRRLKNVTWIGSGSSSKKELM